MSLGRIRFWVYDSDLVVAWAGVPVQLINLREALYWERIGPWSDVRCTQLTAQIDRDLKERWFKYLDPPPFPVRWRGQDADGESVNLSWEALDAVMYQAQPGDITLRFEPPNATTRVVVSSNATEFSCTRASNCRPTLGRAHTSPYRGRSLLNRFAPEQKALTWSRRARARPPRSMT